MNLNTIAEVKRPASADQITQWRDGYAWLAGGTWLFSEPCRLPPTRSSTCNQFAELAGAAAFFRRPRYRGHVHRCGPLPVRRSLGMAGAAGRAGMLQLVPGVVQDSDAATVGGNICMSLPAGPMISLTVALEATYILMAAHRTRTLGPLDRFGDRQPHERPSTRRVAPQISACRHRRCRRESRSVTQSLTHLGRSAALLIGTQSAAGNDLLITITASTPRPIQLRFEHAPSAIELRRAIDECIPADGYFDDVRRLRRLQTPPHPLFRRADPRRAGAIRSARMKHSVVADAHPAAMADGRMNYNVNGKLFSAEPAPGQCLRTFLRDRGVSGSRKAVTPAMRRLHRVARRTPLHSCIVPASAPPGAKSHDLGTGAGRSAAPDAAGVPDSSGFQCGFCAAGMIITASALSAESS